jgi:hypothetical protein
MHLRTLGAIAILGSLPLLTAAKGDGCAANSRSPAPDVTGVWDMTYDDAIDVEVRVGGSTYTATVPSTGGRFTLAHAGKTLSFNLDCARPDVLCPSEAWPARVRAEQRDAGFEHRMIVTLPGQRCTGTLVAPRAGTCGEGTDNPGCDQVCDGGVAVADRETFGVIGESGETFRLYLGAGLATNGVNCALLGWSVADAQLDTTGSADGDDWQAVGMSAGAVEVGYSGGCLWAGDADRDGDLDALLAGATVRFTTGFTAKRSAR